MGPPQPAPCSTAFRKGGHLTAFRCFDAHKAELHVALLAPEATEPVTWKVRLPGRCATTSRQWPGCGASWKGRAGSGHLLLRSGPVRLRVAAAVDARPGWLRGDRAGAGATQAGRAAFRRAWLATGPDLSQRRRWRDSPNRPAACDCEVHQLMQLPQAAFRRACARHLARSESAADCPPGRLFSAVRRQRSGRRVQQLHPADTCGRRRRQVVSRASAAAETAGSGTGSTSGFEAGSGPRPIEVCGVGGQPLSGSALDGEAIANQIISALRFTAEPALQQGCSTRFGTYAPYLTEDLSDARLRPASAITATLPARNSDHASSSARRLSRKVDRE